jgi:SLOG cluster3 family
MNVFLSASFPSGERGEAFAPYDTTAISAAVTAVARAVLLAGGRLVFGAHPTISPLVLAVAADVDRYDAVEIYQSALFRDRIPEETTRLVALRLGRMHLVDADASGELAPSLERMRRAMLSEDVDAGVFIGGMEGIHDEYRLLAELCPGAARLPLTAPGGAARTLALGDDPVSAALADMLGDERYPAVARAIVSNLG